VSKKTKEKKKRKTKKLLKGERDVAGLPNGAKENLLSGRRASVLNSH